MGPITKAGIWKRISAFLLDFIIICIVAAGSAFLVSAVTGYGQKTEKLQEYYSKYEDIYSVKFNITQDEYKSMSDSERANYDEAYNALVSDKEVLRTFNLVISLTIVITSIGILIAVLLTEFVLPLIFKNGQTVGKKVFGLCVCRPDGVRISSLSLFIRTLLGKYTIEIMIPVLIGIMIYFNTIGIIGIIVLALILILEIVLYIVKKSQVIHDLLANTLVVDMASTRLFDTEEEMLEYVKKKAAEKAERETY